MWTELQDGYWKAILGLREQFALMHAKSVADNRFNIIGAVKAVQWDEQHVPILAGWQRDAARRVVHHRNMTLASSRRVKKDRSIGSDMALQNVEVMSLEWLRNNGLRLIQGLSQSNKKAVIEILYNGMSEGQSVQTIARRLKDIVGLDRRFARAVENKRRLLESQGTPQDKVDSKIDRYSKKLLRRRLENIVRTETRAANNEGRLQAWRTMQAEGELPGEAKKVWIVAPDERLCPICAGIGSMKPVPLNKPFVTGDGSFMRPPAHPSCRCTLGLAD